MATRPPQLIVLGPSAAGTHAARLAKPLGVVHVNPRRILRDEADADSVAGQQIRAIMTIGGPVPEELVDRLVRERLETLPPEQGFILDGYPRRSAEARSLQAMLARLGRLEPRPMLIWLEASREKAARRLRRRQDREGRRGGAEASIASRLQMHDAEAQSVFTALVRWVDVVHIDGNRRPDMVTQEILDRLRVCPAVSTGPVRVREPVLRVVE
jgi:adenylate kinase